MRLRWAREIMDDILVRPRLLGSKWWIQCARRWSMGYC